MCDTLSKNQINTILNQKSNSLILTKDYTDNPKREAEIDLKIEEERIKTFKDLTNSRDYAKVGFYYCNNKVKCAFCFIEINFNSFGDSLLDDHLKFSPSCPFARAKKGERTLNTFLKALPDDRDVCGNVDTFPDSVRILSKIVHPYDDYNNRLKSFENWPSSCKQTPEGLAEAGFYYKGIGDKTICFECSGPLNGWEDDDDPWEQHALWFPKCKFVLTQKGQDFIDEVQKRLKTCMPIVSDKEDDENKVLDEDKMCVVCCSRQKEVIFIPCGHDWTCLKCVKALDDKKCPICREQIVQIKNL